MTTTIEGTELTRVGPGTVMGDLMRQYWLPAMLSSELAPDGAPTRLMLLGEKLIAFRDSAGRVGVMADVGSRVGALDAPAAWRRSPALTCRRPSALPPRTRVLRV